MNIKGFLPMIELQASENARLVKPAPEPLLNEQKRLLAMIPIDADGRLVRKLRTEGLRMTWRNSRS